MGKFTSGHTLLRTETVWGISGSDWGSSDPRGHTQAPPILSHLFQDWGGYWASFSCACWPSVWLLWRNVYLGLLHTFDWVVWGFLIVNCMRCLYILKINLFSVAPFARHSTSLITREMQIKIAMVREACHRNSKKVNSQEQQQQKM